MAASRCIVIQKRCAPIAVRVIVLIDRMLRAAVEVVSAVIAAAGRTSGAPRRIAHAIGFIELENDRGALMSSVRRGTAAGRIE